VNHRHINIKNNNKTANIKDKNLKVYNEYDRRVRSATGLTYHTTKTAKIKKGDITLPH